MSSLVRGFITLCVYYLNARLICVVYMRLDQSGPSLQKLFHC